MLKNIINLQTKRVLRLDMNTLVNLVQSGIALVDAAWGGLYRGSTYTVIGAKKSGKSILSLHFAKASVEAGEKCLFFTGTKIKDLTILGHNINFDVTGSINDQKLIVIKVASAAEIIEELSDGYLTDYYRDMLAVISEYKPDRLVFDEFTPFLMFMDINSLRNNFHIFADTLDEMQSTNLLIISEPGDEEAQGLVDIVTEGSTGIIYLQKNSEGKKSSFAGGKATITPITGHLEGQHSATYTIEPYEGIVFPDLDTTNFRKTAEKRSRTTKQINPSAKTEKSESSLQSGNNDMVTPFERSKQKGVAGMPSVPGDYEILSRIETIPDPFSISNIYEPEEFKLILGNQLSLFKSTGQAFKLISVKLDSVAQERKLCTMQQLLNVIRISTEKKDKLCLMGDRILVLLSKADEKAMNILSYKILQNLPVVEEQEKDLLVQLIYVKSHFIDPTTAGVDSLLS